MNREQKNKFSISIFLFFKLFLFFFLFSAFYFLNPNSLSAESITVTADILIVCGNGIVEAGEQCDGANLNGQTCVSLGYVGGTLSCTACSFSTSGCTSGGGGGGGGGGGYVAPVTSVIFLGRAYPKSAIILLKDAQVAASTIAGPNANFQITLSGLTGGNYIFSLYSEDNQGIRSSLLSFPVSVTAGVTTRVSGIFIAPSIAVDKSEVERGDNIAIFGQSAPQADIIISVNSDEEFFTKTISDKDGVYLYNFDTSVLAYETHYTRSKAALDDDISSFSKTISFIVGTKNVFAQPIKIVKGDSNNDNRVNLVDFSIAAYWYKRPSPPAAVDLNSDEKIDLIDFSIMAYYWTG